MERRRKAVPGKSSRRVEPDTAGDQNAAMLGLPHIADLMDFGGITVGQMEPVGCVAIANTEDGCLAMLRRRHGETLAQLLTVSMRRSPKHWKTISTPTRLTPGRKTSHSNNQLCPRKTRGHNRSFHNHTALGLARRPEVHAY